METDSFLRNLREIIQMISEIANTVGISFKPTFNTVEWAMDLPFITTESGNHVAESLGKKAA